MTSIKSSPADLDVYKRQLVDYVAEDLPFCKGDEVAVLVNSLGGTPLEELYILYREINRLLTERGIQISVSYTHLTHI